MRSNFPGQQKELYSVDMVFCIDATGSMENLIEMVKENALNFYQDFCDEMEKKHKSIGNLRVRVIAFRDYLADGEKAMLVTDFFCLPEQNNEFKKCIESIRADGGGDIPEDGLEALAYAIKSDWDRTSSLKRRQVIVVWTDAPTHELGFGKSSSFYPKNMPVNLPELSEWWGDGTANSSEYIDQNAKRLLLFAPEEDYWNKISENWDMVIQCVTDAGEGLKKEEYAMILDAICQTVS